MTLIRILFGIFCCFPVFAGDVESIRSALLTKEYVTDETKNIANTPLLEAAIENDTNKLALLLQQGADPNEGNARGDRPIMFSSWYGNVEALEALVKFGADVNVISRFKDPALMWATMSTKMDAVRFLVESGADIHMKSQFQITVLMEAAGAGHREMVDFYVDRGIDIYAFEKLGNDAAAWAERAGFEEIAAHLRELKKKDAIKLAAQQEFLESHTDNTVRQKVERSAFLTDKYSAVLDNKKGHEDAKPVLVYFYANYCPVCRATDPHLTEFMEQHGEKVELVKVNIEKHNLYTDEDSLLIEKLREDYKLYGIPAFLLASRKPSEEKPNVKSKMGMLTFADYQEWILPFVEEDAGKDL